MNPLARRTILRKSRIFGYSSAILSIPFAFLGGLIASCCPFGVLVGSAPLLVTSALGALLAALFLDYSVVTKRESTSAGMKVGVRSAVLSALVGGIFTTLTASQTLVGVMSATQGSSGQEAPAGAPIMIGIMNLLMLLLVVGLCVIPGIIWGVIGAALKGSAALDVEPEPSADWDEQSKQINKGSLIEWGVILGLLLICSLVVPAIQGMMVAGRQRSSPISYASPYQHSYPRNNTPSPLPSRPSSEHASWPEVQPANRTAPFSVSPSGDCSVLSVHDIGTEEKIIVKKGGVRVFEVDAGNGIEQVLWSPGEQFLALNLMNKRNGGTHLEILDLKTGAVIVGDSTSFWANAVQMHLDVPWKVDAKNGRLLYSDSKQKALKWEDENILNVALEFEREISNGAKQVYVGSARLAVKHESLGIIDSTKNQWKDPEILGKENELGTGLLHDSCHLKFLQSTRELVFTFEWAARYGAWRQTVKIDDLQIGAATGGETHTKGAFEGSFPLQFPLKLGAKMKLEKWDPTTEKFAWSRSPDRVEEAGGPFSIILLKELRGSDDQMEQLIQKLNQIARSGSGWRGSVPETGIAKLPSDETEKVKNLLLGRWIERKLVAFFPDGTWAVQRNEEAPLDKSGRRWELVGNKLKRSFPGGEVTVTIVSVDAVELKLRDDSGNVIVYRREQEAPGKLHGEVHPETRLRLLAESDVSGWSVEQCQFAINEMFARHGLYFQKEEVRIRFEKNDWYRPDPLLQMDEIEERFSEFEKANLKLLGDTRNKARIGAKVPLPVLSELDGKATGTAHGIQFVGDGRENGFEFRRERESRLDYSFKGGFPIEGTLEMRLFVERGYGYADGVLIRDKQDALVFTTVGPDTWYPGAAWLTVCNSGEIRFGMATGFGGQTPNADLVAKDTTFRFNEWHTVGVTYGPLGRAINVDGKIVAKDGFQMKLAPGGTLNKSVDRVSIGEFCSSAWPNNRHDSGFEGLVDRVKLSRKQSNWSLSRQEP